jgi:hypothetical protein
MFNYRRTCCMVTNNKKRKSIMRSTLYKSKGHLIVDLCGACIKKPFFIRNPNEALIKIHLIKNPN